MVSKSAGCLQKDDVGRPKGVALALDTTRSNTSLKLKIIKYLEPQKLLNLALEKDLQIISVIFLGQKLNLSELK